MLGTLLAATSWLNVQSGLQDPENDTLGILQSARSRNLKRGLREAWTLKDRADCTCLCARSGKGIRPRARHKVRSRPSGARMIQMRYLYEAIPRLAREGFP